MTLRSEPDANAEIPTDFASHLAERLHLAPDAVLAHLESWLVRYPRTERPVPGPVKAAVWPNDPCVDVRVG